MLHVEILKSNKERGDHDLTRFCVALFTVGFVFGLTMTALVIVVRESSVECVFEPCGGVLSCRAKTASKLAPPHSAPQPSDRRSFPAK